MTPQISFLSEVANYFNSARQNLVAGAAGLYKIKEEKLWEPHYDSFSGYLADIQVSDGMASKLIATYQFYVLESGLPQEQLAEVDHEKLYMALKLPVDARKRLASARTLSRQELRQEVKDPQDTCEHLHTGNVCFDCHKRL